MGDKGATREHECIEPIMPDVEFQTCQSVDLECGRHGEVRTDDDPSGVTVANRVVTYTILLDDTGGKAARSFGHRLPVCKNVRRNRRPENQGETQKNQNRFPSQKVSSPHVAICALAPARAASGVSTPAIALLR